MQRWEYHIEVLMDFGNTHEHDRRSAITAKLNDLGTEGWEVVAVTSGRAGTAENAYSLLFKRPADTKRTDPQVFIPADEEP